MTDVCALCREPAPDLVPREILGDIDTRRHRLLDRSLHQRCLASWAHREAFTAQFHDAARRAGHRRLTLAADGTLQDSRPLRNPLTSIRDAFAFRIALLRFPEDVMRRSRHTVCLMMLAARGLAILVLLLLTALSQAFLPAPGGTVLAATLAALALAIAGEAWVRMPTLLDPRHHRSWWQWWS